jgi:hypothetical protein
MTIDEDSLNKKFFHLFCYYSATNSKVAAINLWLNGVRIFNNATCIKHFTELNNINFSQTEPPNLNQLFPFIDDNIIDNTRIVICFENFMKGVLMLNGFIAHVLSLKHKQLKKQQKNRPIKTDEVFIETSFKAVNTKEVNELDICNTTLNFSVLLKPEYQKIINLPLDILEFLKEINSIRNRLHFMSNSSYFIGKDTLINIEKIIKFAQNVIIPRTVDLQQHLNSKQT